MFSCDLLSLYPAVHFLNIRLSVIMTIMNSNDEGESPWKLTFWICALPQSLRAAVNSTLQVLGVFSIKFMSSFDILYIFRQFVIKLWGTISYAFL